MSQPARVCGVVFDLDGTLIDSRKDIAAAVNHVLPRHGFPTLPEDRIARYVGDGARMLLLRASSLGPEDPRLEPLHSDFLGYYAAHAADRTVLMPFARETLRELEDLPLAICTNKPRLVTEAVLAALLPDFPSRNVVAGGDVPKAKPDPASLLLLSERSGVQVASLVLVGDGAQDILCAKAAGARSIAVTGGFTSRERLRELGPTALVDSLRDTVPLIRRWAEGPQDTRA